MYSKSKQKALYIAFYCTIFLTLQLWGLDKSQALDNLVRSNQYLYIVSQAAGVLATIGTLFLYFPMVFHCVRWSNLSRIGKIAWILMFVVFIWVGSLLYYLIVYRRMAAKIEE